ncbi:unnamed protein product (macronuclear) [Paramecium tetraurelia]|uniref:Transmembrane protein n=1 Tax=Paramecium tetraurelia TaxID=5888 RepID=A0E8H3_PARTE|nr:uncharacterized protein GSPATT00024319001 [Paramecium tetraurelia]CAK91590.1 unnamed protein product [Paramecium tetraurelia]|eukprot:XP_001458987.1 hypothetical protein (macronuclear) [Paramecium tetraurelia strain d4-2]
MEITLTATIFSLFGWNVYLLIKKYRERLRQNFLHNLIDQESDNLIKNVAPYKKIKANEQSEKVVKKTQLEEAESSSDDNELIQYRRSKTILDEVRQENFQEQCYIQNSTYFDIINGPCRKDRRQNRHNKDFSFTTQNQDSKQMKKFRKNSKIYIDDSLPFESPKKTNKNSSNKVSEKKINQFDFSGLKDQFDTQDQQQDQQQELTKCVTDLASQFELKQDNQNQEGNTNPLQFSLQPEKANDEVKEQSNQQQGETVNIFGKFITQAPPQLKDKQQQEQKQLSPQPQPLQQEPAKNNFGLFSNLLNTTNPNPDVVTDKIVQPVQINQMPQVQIQNLNNGFQLKINEQNQPQQQQQNTSLFQNLGQINNNQIPIFNLNNQNQDSINKNGSADIKQSSAIQNTTPSSFTFGVNSNIQTNSQGGLFDNLLNKNGGLFGNQTTSSYISQDQINNKPNLFSSQPQQTQSNLIQPQPNTGSTLFGNILSGQQPKEQNQQSQTGGLFNFSSNTQVGSGLFGNLLKS